MDSREFVDIFSLGTNDYGEYGLDASDEDQMINIATYPNLYGLRMPDAIDFFKSNDGREYIFTANEGDSKDFDESRVYNLDLDETSFDEYNVTELQLRKNLGRLIVTNLWGISDNDNNSTYSELYAFSSRDFTIFEVIRDENGEFEYSNFVYSNNNDFETISADMLGEDGFNANYHNPSFDTRSDNKGPEPESIATGTCNNGRSFAFIGMERVSGIFVYDITNLDDGEVQYIEYINNRDFTVEYLSGTRAPEEAGDVGPEQVRFVAEDVFGMPLLLVANAESSSVTMYRIDCEGGGVDGAEDESGLTDVEIVVIVLASVIGVILLVVLCVCYVERRREKRGYNGVSTDMTKLAGNDKTKYNTVE